MSDYGQHDGTLDRADVGWQDLVTNHHPVDDIEPLDANADAEREAENAFLRVLIEGLSINTRKHLVIAKTVIEIVGASPAINLAALKSATKMDARSLAAIGWDTGCTRAALCSARRRILARLGLEMEREDARSKYAESAVVGWATRRRRKSEQAVKTCPDPSENADESAPILRTKSTAGGS